MKPSGIEPAAFRFVAQRLNHCATVVPGTYWYHLKVSRIHPETSVTTSLRCTTSKKDDDIIYTAEEA